MKETLIVANMDSEKHSVAMLTKALEERDRQIEELNSRVENASSDMKTNTKLMKDMEDRLIKGKPYSYKVQEV